MISFLAVLFEWLMVSVVFEVLIKVMAWPVLTLVRFLFFGLTLGRYNLSQMPLFKARGSGACQQSYLFACCFTRT